MFRDSILKYYTYSILKILITGISCYNSKKY